MSQPAYRVPSGGLGNVCRSAGLAAEHLGESTDLRSQSDVLQCTNALSALRARQLTQKDFVDFDRMLVIDDGRRGRLEILQQCAEKSLKKQALHASLSLMVAQLLQLR
jgi:protein-tyrosine phosphatase